MWLLIFKKNLLYLSNVGLGLNPLNIMKLYDIVLAHDGINLDLLCAKFHTSVENVYFSLTFTTSLVVFVLNIELTGTIFILIHNP